LVFIKQVARIIAIADNHYPVFMLNSKQMNDALQHAIYLSRTAKSTYSDVEDRNYMEPILQNEEVKEADQEKAEQSPLGTHADVVDNEQDDKLPESHQVSSGHGDAGTQEDFSSCLNQESGNDDTNETQRVIYALQPVYPKQRAHEIIIGLQYKSDIETSSYTLQFVAPKKSARLIIIGLKYKFNL
jgi:hypothetical protein